jgi:DNA-binding NarL/FixJ family response regulator
MERRRVALLCAQQLLGESLEHTLRKAGDVELLGPWALDEQALSHFSSGSADMVVIVEAEDMPQEAAQITAQILERFPSLPIIRVTLEQNVVRFYSTQVLPARSSDLIDLIHSLPVAGQSGDS